MPEAVRTARRIRASIPVASVLIVVSVLISTSARAPTDSDPTPLTLGDFKAAANRVVVETGIPGAGIALVSVNGAEWVGGFGYADRERQTPITADTHFRVGSISKTLVALALVQLYEEGRVDFMAPVAEIAPDIAIDNPWHHTDPVRVIHLLQHTAGFDDMHFNERYVPQGEADLTLDEVLRINPRSRRVRWRPGTRMSYSNPGYAIAGLLIEKLTGEPYEDYIKRQIFDPLGMSTSSFRLSAADEVRLARGYNGSDPKPVGFPRIYLRPAGNMHSSPREMAQLVRMLLGWGEIGSAFVVDPEYLGSMEQPRTSLASMAGLRNGYGSGIAALVTFPYPLLGHGGGIDGFLSQYAYSPARDVGYVILLNSIGRRSQEAMDRLSSLAIRYLKRDVEPQPKPEIKLDAATLDRYVGYYHDATPRNQFAWPVQSLLSGRTIERGGSTLYSVNLVGKRDRLLPVSETLFRFDREVDASIVFTRDDDGVPLMTGINLYAERRPRWRVEMIRIPVVAAALALASVLPVAVVWVVRARRPPRGFWQLKTMLLACPMVFLVPIAALALTSERDWGTRNAATITFFLATLALPVLTAVVTVLSLAAGRRGASRLLVVYGLVIAYAMAALTAYLGWHDFLGLRMWRY
jgi:CubicO group peptidase (beta-lactamase class C family)